ncbi:hypothetical protein B7494_g2545 [Chlorociboria aeruginascens]|nr:hypothetical protein B7494_g2545 [Chlorociboria aeruginascens]
MSRIRGFPPVLLATVLGIGSEIMRKQVSDTFDASVTTGKSPPQVLQTHHKNPNVDESKSKDETEEERKTRKLREKREKELSAPKMLDLKNDAIEFFDKWRESVISRVGSVMNSSKETAETQKKKASTATLEDPPLEPKVIRSNTNSEDADAALIELYPPTSTSLYSLDKDKRILLLHSMLLLLLSLEHYIAHSRILLLHIASSLHLPLHILTEQEVKVAQGLLEAAKHMSGSEETQKRAEDNKVARRWKVGLAGVAGAAVIGITGGLAAPLVAGAIAYGSRMSSKMMDAYAKEVDDFAFLPLKSNPNHKLVKDVPAEDRRLRVTIGISGWLTQKEDIITPWRVFGQQSEVFALRWELEPLMKLGSSLEAVVKSAAWSVAKKEIIARTIFASLMDALWPIALLKVSRVVDNPFSVAMSRADKAGLVLADALINKAQGERPVTLIGYSLGARLVYSCLMELGRRRAFGLVESAILLGMPAPSDEAAWRVIRAVVTGGRLVNVYSENDYILAFLYRTSSIQYGVAGLQEIQDVKGIENVNVSEMVSGHLRYQYLVGSILEKIGFEDIDVVEVAKEEETLALMEEAEKKEEESTEKKELTPDEEADKMEKDVKVKTDQTFMQQAAQKLHLSV